MTITAKELLHTKLHGNSSLRDILYSHVEEGGFGADLYLKTDEEEEAFYLSLAEKILELAK